MSDISAFTGDVALSPPQAATSMSAMTARTAAAIVFVVRIVSPQRRFIVPSIDSKAVGAIAPTEGIRRQPLSGFTSQRFFFTAIREFS
jgi:hypothetical protein